MNTTTIVNFNGYGNNYTLNEIDKCPICKHAIKPVQINCYVYCPDSSLPNSYTLVFTYLCKACNDVFVAKYEKVNYNAMSRMFNGGSLVSLAPNKFKSENFTDLIANTSPKFVKIYNQALSAETSELDEIAGIGYRKALEFLIKDFLIFRNPDQKESIEKTQLGACVNNFIDNPQLKIAASRAVWLGNDQTHYIQKFDDKDIEDLKRLIRLTVHWISMILETELAATIEPKK